MNRHTWTESETLELTRRYPHEHTATLAASMGMRTSQINSKAYSLDLHKTPEYLASAESGRTDGTRGGETRFKPGLATWNKGQAFDSGGRSHETRFKPGHRGGKAVEMYQPIGTERLSKDGYIQRKINDGMPMHQRWRGVHLLVWEEANGPIPAGHAVTFRDGNKQNCALDNLQLISRTDLMKRNTYHNYGKEIARLVQLKGAVTRQINKRERKSS